MPAAADDTHVAVEQVSSDRVGPPGQQSGSHANHNAKGSPFMVSGEIFLRSAQDTLFCGSSSSDDPAGTSTAARSAPATDRATSCSGSGAPQAGTFAAASCTDSSAPAAPTSRATGHPSTGVLAGLSGELRDLLLCHPESNAGGEPGEGVDPAAGGLCGLVSSVRVERRSVRRKRIDYLETTKTIAGSLATARLVAAQAAAGGYREGCAESRAQLDCRLGGLVLSFADAASAEMGAEDAQTAAEGEHCRREVERLELAARLASLAATAEHRTRGCVVLRRLPPTHPQHERCLRAATENVRPGFFSSESRYGAVRVLDIYKMENRFLLERFQRAAEAREPCKVKGLFCHVPDASLEHVVLYGMGGASALMDECGGYSSGAASKADGKAGISPAYDWDIDPIDPFLGAPTVGVSGGRETSGGNNGSRPLEFPRAFSRHSTLEEERQYANRSSCGCDGEDRGMRQHHPPWSPPSAGCHPLQRQRLHRVPGDRSHEGRQQRGAVSGLRFLALCRVMIGSTHVAATASPATWGQRKGNVGTPPHDPKSSSPRHRTDSIALQKRQGTSSPRSAGRPADDFYLPAPPPGQAEFDSVYFPREEEYRILNEAFVLPEFVVVHRFVAAEPPPGQTMNTEGHNRRSPRPNTSCGVANDDHVPVVVMTGGREQHQPTAGVHPLHGKEGAEKISVAGGRCERENQEQGWRRFPSNHANGFATPSSTPATLQDAASVVEGIEAAMEGVVLPQRNNFRPHTVTSSDGVDSPTAREAVEAPCFSPRSNGCGGGATFTSSRDGTMVGGREGSLSLTPNIDSGDLGTRNGRREHERARRASIVYSIEQEFERFWQETNRLRELQKSEVVKGALSRGKLRQPP